MHLYKTNFICCLKSQFFFEVLACELRASCMLGKCSTTEMDPKPSFIYYFVNVLLSWLTTKSGLNYNLCILKCISFKVYSLVSFVVYHNNQNLEYFIAPEDSLCCFVSLSLIDISCNLLCVVS